MCSRPIRLHDYLIVSITKGSVNIVEFLHRDNHQRKETSESTTFSQACPATSKLAKICHRCFGVI